MRARLMGFVWKLGNGIDLDEFFAHLKGLQNQAVKYGSYDRLLYVGDRDNCHLGLLLTIKDQRKTCEIQEQSGEFKVNVRSLEEGSNLVDFNFFAIKKASGKGLYQHYHNSCSFNQFCLYCKHHYEDLRESKKSEQIKALGPAPTTKQRKMVAAAFKGTLKWEVMVRQERLPELLQELEQINLFEFDFVTLTAHEELFCL